MKYFVAMLGGSVLSIGIFAGGFICGAMMMTMDIQKKKAEKKQVYTGGPRPYYSKDENNE